MAVCWMAYRTGAELFVFDLALALLRRGHSVVVYAPVLGDMADELRQQSVACTADLSLITETPDLIIGSTRDDTVACLAQFIGVPAISICHDRSASHGSPPHFSRIRQYVAVDANCAERLTLESGISASKVSIVFNGVDLQRFQRRAPLPAQPQRAVIFSSYATLGHETEAVRQACEALGVSLEIVGRNVGRLVARPEDILGQYDLVFAKARCAMEAMAVGCAVVVLNEGGGLAGMVTSENVQEWRRWNFGRRLFQQSIDVEGVRQEVLRFNASDAAQVCDYVRTHMSLEVMASHFERLATDVLAAEATQSVLHPDQELKEFSRHLIDNLRPFGTPYVAQQTEALLSSIQMLEQQSISANARIAELYEQLRLSRSECLERDQRLQALQALQSHAQELERQLKALQDSRSWRLLAPIRWAVSRARKVLNG